jgi:hypothetical protein
MAYEYTIKIKLLFIFLDRFFTLVFFFLRVRPMCEGMDNSYPEPTNYMSFLQFFSLPAEGRATHTSFPPKSE